MFEECGENLRQWFGALSGRALEEAIKEVCQRFDLHGSGHIGQQEFAKAMHFLGLRLTAEQYNILFSEYDLDGSGEMSTKIRQKKRKLSHLDLKTKNSVIRNFQRKFSTTSLIFSF